jgi:RNA polymerase sigma-70 factor (ECF subfamily)
MTAAHRIEDLGQYRPKLVRFARARLFNPAHAEDAVQETLLAAIESIDKFSGGSSLFSWLTGILKHKIVDCVRRSAREQWQEMDNDGIPLNAADRDCSRMDDCPGGCAGWGDPEKALLRRRRLEALERCVRQLPERTAETFVLREVVGLNTAETCQALAVSEANCAVMLHRARARIRESLDPEWMTP